MILVVLKLWQSELAVKLEPKFTVGNERNVWKSSINMQVLIKTSTLKIVTVILKISQLKPSADKRNKLTKYLDFKQLYELYPIGWI